MTLLKRLTVTLAGVAETNSVKTKQSNSRTQNGKKILRADIHGSQINTD